jgi:hypothetical protein
MLESATSDKIEGEARYVEIFPIPTISLWNCHVGGSIGAYSVPAVWNHLPAATQLDIYDRCDDRRLVW